MQDQFRKIATLAQTLADSLERHGDPIHPAKLMTHFIATSPEATRVEIECAFGVLFERGVLVFDSAMDIIAIKVK